MPRELQQVPEADFGLGLGAGGKQRGGRQGVIEREPGKRKVFEIH